MDNFSADIAAIERIPAVPAILNLIYPLPGMGDAAGPDRANNMSIPPSTSAAARLCTACGLCCNGVMFHTVRLQPKDSAPALVALGLKLKRKNRHTCIQQPCPAYLDAQCSIYAERPERCRLFECQQLQRLEAGEITEADALAKIRQVQRRAGTLDALSRRADGSLRKGPLSMRCETALAEPFDATTQPELIAQREELARGLAELDAMLDAEFRVPTSAFSPAVANPGVPT